VSQDRSDDRLRARQAEISRLLEKHRLLDDLTHRQHTTKRELLEAMQHRQNLVALESHCRTLHPADLAVGLEGLPREDRELVWRQSPPAVRGEALVEMADTVRDSLIAAVDSGALADARDPAQGSSVLLTFITDSMAFLLFLGLARLFLV
jgi:magnesium transporter